MFAQERKDEILRLLKENGKVKTLELADYFKVSEPTIRRDIADLELSGKLIRTHGGALPIQMKEDEPSFKEKIDRFANEKKYIGKIAASMIRDGESIILDGGTTTLEILRNISAKDITVITNSIDIAEESENMEHITMILLGGQVRWNTRALVGPVTEKILRTFCVDKAFIGANGIDVEVGISTQNLMEATTKNVMIDVAKRAFVVTDHTKFNKRELCIIDNFNHISGIITDEGISDEVIKDYESRNIDIIVK